MDAQSESPGDNFFDFVRQHGGDDSLDSVWIRQIVQRDSEPLRDNPLAWGRHVVTVSAAWLSANYVFSRTKTLGDYRAKHLIERDPRREAELSYLPYCPRGAVCAAASLLGFDMRSVHHDYGMIIMAKKVYPRLRRWRKEEKTPAPENHYGLTTSGWYWIPGTVAPVDEALSAFAPAVNAWDRKLLPTEAECEKHRRNAWLRDFPTLAKPLMNQDSPSMK